MKQVRSAQRGGAARLLGALTAALVLLGLVPADATAYAGAPWFEPGKVYTQNFPDPSVLRVGDTYYAYGTATGGAYLPVMTSKDLKTWTARTAYDPGAPLNADPYFNDALPYPAKWGAERPTTHRMKKSVWAPGVFQVGTQYVAYYSIQVQLSPARYCITRATSTSPLGPFVDNSTGPLVCDPDPAGSIDPQPYLDPATGTPWLIWKSEGVVGSMPTRIWSRQLDVTGTGFAPGSTPQEILRTSQGWEGNVIENPSMIRGSEGQLYLFYSGNEWASAEYAMGYATCVSPRGPCTKARTTPLLKSTNERLGQGGGAAFLDTTGRLQLAHHYWNAPYTNYPTYPACEKDGTCTTQGQRRMAVTALSGSGTGLRLGAAPSLGGPSRFVPLTPKRVLDTRSGLGAPVGKVPPGGRITLQATGHGGVPSTGVSAVVVNVTITGATGPGYVQAYPTGRGREGASSNLNVTSAGQTIAGLVTTPVGDDGKVTVHTSGGGHLVADVAGYYTPASSATAGRYNPLTPSRVLDTRTGTKPGARAALTLKVTGRGGVPSSGVGAVAVNVTATQASQNGYVQVVPTGGSTPLGASSNLNVVTGQTVANLVIVPVGSDGTVTLYTSNGTHLLADVAGWYTDATAPSATSGLFVPVEPTRLLDTRLATRVSAAGQVRVRPGAQLGTSRTPSAAVLTVTVTQPEGAGYVQALPTNRAPLGSSSTVNVERSGQTIANSALTALGEDGQVSLYTARATHLVTDVSGWFT